jgi:DNA-binding MarR family transcriptional regulator
MSTARTPHKNRLVADVAAIPSLRNRPGVWLSFAGAAFYKRYAAELGREGLKPSWITALAIVQYSPGITQSAMGRWMAINRASAMALSVSIEEAGLLIRTPLSGRNQMALALTERGEAMLEKGCEIEDKLTKTVLKSIGEMDRQVFIDCLKRIEQALAQSGTVAVSDD